MIRIYESYDILKIKEKAGILFATQELQYRKIHKELVPLQGLESTSIYMVLTEEIKNKLISIDNLYGKINSNHKVKDVIFLDAYHSATIEGARTTVENVRKSYDQPKTKDDKMVINTIHGMNYAYENRINMENIRNLWELITKDVCDNSQLAGERFRDGMVYVGSNTDIIHTPANPEDIEKMMQDMFTFMQTSEFNIWIKAAISHFYIVYIHPYCDGNGRTARVLTQSFLLHNGLDKIKCFSLSRAINDNLSGYYASLKESEKIYQNGKKWIDITPFIDYFLDTIEKGMITSLKEDHQLSEKQKLLLSKMQKRGKGTEITIENAAGILKVSEQTAAKHLNGLVEMGYLEKIKRGRRNIYILQ